jgi:diaminopimelate epimerase
MGGMMKFGKAYKYHGLGNDFVLFDSIKSKKLISPKNAVFICDRHYGVGADGVLTLLPSRVADFYMHIYNSDGSVAEMCGNGIRCAVKHFVDNYKINSKTIRVETKKGVQTCEYFLKNREVNYVLVNMGSPVFQPDKIPVNSKGNRLKIRMGKESISGFAVSMGNPHFVTFEKYSEKDVYRWGPYIEKHSFFPNHTNVEFARIISREEILLYVWERGVGVTLACGSGSCATVVAGVKEGLIAPNEFIKVRLPGGDLYVKYDIETDQVYMKGPARRVFGIEF